MNTKEQIKILQKARKMLLLRVVYNFLVQECRKDYYLCNILLEILFKIKNKSYARTVLYDFIPTFTIIEAAKVTKVHIPTNYGVHASYIFCWWERTDFKSRLKFLNYLIKNLKHK